MAVTSYLLRFTETEDVQVDASGITIFVGPNNSGKSLALREMKSQYFYEQTNTLVAALVHADVTRTEIERALAQYTIEVPQDEFLPDDHIRLGNFDSSGLLQTRNVHRDSLYNVADGDGSAEYFNKEVLSLGVSLLDGRSRFSLIVARDAGDIDKPPTNMLSFLFSNDGARREVQKVVRDCLGVNLIVDATSLGQFRLRITVEELPADEQSLRKEFRDQIKSALLVEHASDGVQAFIGIICSIMSAHYHTILIDEPEAFLHPPLARRLGRVLGDYTKTGDANLMVSTHSSDFLMGCIESGQNVRVVRMEYRNKKSRGILIESNDLRAFFQRPLIRSSNVLSALFYDGVVVSESDNDRAFYQEIYRLIADGRQDAPSILFINAQNKQTIRDIIGPLRKFGVPAAAITDIDILKDGGGVFAGWLQSANVPHALHLGLGQQRSALCKAFDVIGKDMKANGGVEFLPDGDKDAANEFFDGLNRWGVFPVRGGELESWLPKKGIEGKKTDWAVSALNRLEHSTNREPLVPDGTDVWKFMNIVIDWIADPGRKGM
ncbi:AAA family ATPase [Falsirhodobacter xinxiangensis]|uniref:AAA family ATPase n=1 Tax=Falsirhodobacter xinxiangensis TaxID=2530049 RepID=UPI0010AA96F7|nr:AAA family ATPase [Rhodobacter xinxiangensis]